MNSPLTLIPAKVRLGAYLGYFLLALAFTSISAYFQALHEAIPNWAIGGAAAIVPVGAAFAAVAASNTTQQPALSGAQNADVAPTGSVPVEPETSTPAEAPAASDPTATPAGA